jgi:hypothetical protein
MKARFWPYSVDTYDIFLLLKKKPRITKHALAKKFHVTEKTAATWWRSALEKKILLLPEFRRKAFENFYEYFYYLKVEDPHEYFERLIHREEEIKKDIIHFSVQSGFCNFQIVSNKKINPEGEIILCGARSDYFISTPRRTVFDNAIGTIKRKLSAIGSMEVQPSPLVYHESIFEDWDEFDEKIYYEFSENMRKPFKSVLERTGAKRDQILDWLKRRDQFGHTIVMYFPLGLNAYQPTIYCINTSHDFLIIDFFSSLPVPTVFYRIGEKLMVKVYLQNDILEGKYISNKVLSELRKKELVDGYTNSTVQYYYRL